MIFLDTNLFQRFFVAPVTDQDRIWQAQAIGLMNAVKDGTIHATCSEVVIHEVCQILVSKRQCGMPTLDIVDFAQSVLSFASMRFDGEQGTLFLRALGIWADHPRLEFSDLVIAARSERSGHELATCDRHFRDLPFLEFWPPEIPVPDST